MGWIDFQQAMMTGEKPVISEAEMSFVATSD